MASVRKKCTSRNSVDMNNFLYSIPYSKAVSFGQISHLKKNDRKRKRKETKKDDPPKMTQCDGNTILSSKRLHRALMVKREEKPFLWLPFLAKKKKKKRFRQPFRKRSSKHFQMLTFLYFIVLYSIFTSFFFFSFFFFKDVLKLLQALNGFCTLKKNS